MKVTIMKNPMFNSLKLELINTELSDNIIQKFGIEKNTSILWFKKEQDEIIIWFDDLVEGIENLNKPKICECCKQEIKGKVIKNESNV